MTLGILLIATAPWSAVERLAGAMADTGVAVDALYPSGHALAHCRHVRRHFRYSGLAPLNCIRRAIAKSAPRLLIAGDDRAASLLSALSCEATHEEAALLDFSFGKPFLFQRLGNRNFFIAECARAGVRVAEMIAVPALDAFEPALARLGLPVAVKSDHSWGGEGVVIAHTREAARAAYLKLAATPTRLRALARAARRRDPHFVTVPRTPSVGLQRFVAGAPATSSIACWRGELIAANHFDVVASQTPDGPATVLARSVCPHMQEAARRIARHFGLSGLHGLDYIRDPSGTVHLLEINPRATPTHHLALASDPCHALLAAAGIAAPPRPAVTAAHHIALFPQEWRRDPASRHLTAAFHDVPWDDPDMMEALTGREFGLEPILTMPASSSAALPA